MKLEMHIAGQLIDTIAVDKNEFGKPGYLEYLKAELIIRHQALINESILKPVFFVDHVPSRMNK